MLNLNKTIRKLKNEVVLEKSRKETTLANCPNCKKLKQKVRTMHEEVENLQEVYLDLKQRLNDDSN